ncbi:unnamed protein product [Heligmosomoides polygyrus]|uniref:DUF5753 domain-containing protein n=1 Tax=Heligmosomoides polygyrus TaxID=6339 RepID=A0A183GNJ3_HELPZ|nr:unnamed protein product [Heligmosomoides polygyrus]
MRQDGSERRVVPIVLQEAELGGVREATVVLMGADERSLRLPQSEVSSILSHDTAPTLVSFVDDVATYDIITFRRPPLTDHLSVVVSGAERRRQFRCCTCRRWRQCVGVEAVRLLVS